VREERQQLAQAAAAGGEAGAHRESVGADGCCCRDGWISQRRVAAISATNQIR
jgi:hypothetical protein